MFFKYSKINQRDTTGKLLYASDPDYCCYLNKVAPLEPILAEHDIWINGVRADQSDVRKSFEIEQKAKFGVIRFHPMLDWNGKMIYQYLNEYNIPRHPLEEKGYFSIGCEPCTRKFDLDTEGRGGRWFGLKNRVWPQHRARYQIIKTHFPQNKTHSILLLPLFKNSFNNRTCAY